MNAEIEQALTKCAVYGNALRNDARRCVPVDTRGMQHGWTREQRSFHCEVTHVNVD